MEFLEALISTMVATITGLFEGVTPALVNVFQEVFQNKTVTGDVVTYAGISSLGAFIMMFIGVGFCFGVFRLIKARML